MGAGAGGVEGIVGRVGAVAGEERAADHHLAILHVQAIVRPVVKVVGVLAENLAVLNVHHPGLYPAHGDIAAWIVASQNTVGTATVAHGDVAQLARAAIKDQPRPLGRAAVSRRGEGDLPAGFAHRLQVPQDRQLDAVPAHHHHTGLQHERRPGWHGQIVPQFVPFQALGGLERDVRGQASIAQQHAVPAVAGEGVVRQPAHVICTQSHCPASVVLEIRVGDGDLGAGAGGVEGIVGRVRAVAGEQDTGDRHLAVLHVQAIVLSGRGLVIAQGALFDAHLPVRHAPHGDPAPVHNPVAITGVAHGGMAQASATAIEN